jgi:hypothetical protein
LSAQIPTIEGVNDQKPRTVYIDINHWYALGRADMGSPDKPEHAAVLSRLQGEVDAGRLVIPLSSVTYTELTENPRDQLREAAAGVMLKLSRLVTIAPRPRSSTRSSLRNSTAGLAGQHSRSRSPRSGTASASPSAPLAV